MEIAELLPRPPASVKPAAWSLPARLRGIVPPMITPLRDRDVLDTAGLERLVEHILAGGVHGLFILGSSGEAPALSYRLRRELIERVCRQVRGRVPVLVGITDTIFGEAINLARHAADSGAQAVVTSAPYYLPPSQPEMIHFIKRLAQELPLPLFLYNMPQLTKVQFDPETLRRVSHLKNIVGIKDSSGDLNYFNQLLALKAERPDWSVFIGPEHLMAEAVRRGGDGGVNGGATFYPQLYVDLFNAVVQKDSAAAAELQNRLLQLGQIFSVGRHASAVVKAMKCSCSLLGLCDDFMAEPFERFAPPERERIKMILTSVGLLRGQTSTAKLGATNVV